MATIVITERALQDLRGIRKYSVDESGEATAEKYLDDIEAALTRLSEMPSLLREEPRIAPGLYFHRVRKHLLACDMIGEFIYLLTVIHCSRDIPERMMEMQPTLADEVAILHRRLQQHDKSRDER